MLRFVSEVHLFRGCVDRAAIEQCEHRAVISPAMRALMSEPERLPRENPAMMRFDVEIIAKPTSPKSRARRSATRAPTIDALREPTMATGGERHLDCS
jgi:hypothetical protein